MKLYVAGFLFNDTGTFVTVVEKKKFPPGFDWSQNPLNAVGGKIEEGETPEVAMVREFKEETGVETHRSDWDHFLEVHTSRWSVSFFRCFNSRYQAVTRTVEEERILDIQTRVPLSGVVPNLLWIIPMALNKEINFAAVVERE